MVMKKLWKSGKIRVMERWSQKLIQILGQGVVLVLLLGLAVCSGDLISRLEKGERPKGARDKLTKMAFNNPNNLRVQEWTLRLEVEEGNLKAAERRLAMLRIKAPKDYVTMASACYLNLKKEAWKEAVPFCEKAYELSSRKEDLNRLSSVYLKLKKYDQALPFLQAAAKKFPGDPRALNNLGYGLMLKKDYQTAEPLFQKAVKLDPEYLSARKNLARIYYETNKFQEAVKELKAILGIAPADKEALFNLAMIYAVNLKDMKTAKEYAGQALKLGPEKGHLQALTAIMAGNQPPLSTEGEQPRIKTCQQ